MTDKTPYFYQNKGYWYCRDPNNLWQELGPFESVEDGQQNWNKTGTSIIVLILPLVFILLGIVGCNIIVGPRG